MPGTEILEQIKIELKDVNTGDLKSVYLDIFDNSLSRKWLPELNRLLENNYHLEKNYCFLGWDTSPRNLEYLCTAINRSIQAINDSDLDYTIDDYFAPDNVIYPGVPDPDTNAGEIVHDKMNQLHVYFEDLQGSSSNISSYYTQADAETQWHIRQLNLLCHETECFALSRRQGIKAPAWRRPSQLMCWLNAPRFQLDEQDYEQFGVDTIARSLGGVYVGVNKAVGKHHWEVFNDEGRDSRIDELTTTNMASQTEAAGDFDIEWGDTTKRHAFMENQLNDFRQWLTANGFDPEDPSLTIGHPQIGQVNLEKSFGTENCERIWNDMQNYLDVYTITTSDAGAKYEYHWQDQDYQQQQVRAIQNQYDTI